MMNQIRFQQVHKGQTETARKVYSVMPIAEPWGFSQIAKELDRLGIQIRWDIMQGCVASLVACGIVDEPRRGHFIRASVRPEPVATPAPPPMLHIVPPTGTPMPLPAPPAKSTMEKLADIAESLRKLSHAANTIANDIDTIALEVEEGNGAERKELAKLRQLRDLLRDT